MNGSEIADAAAAQIFATIVVAAIVLACVMVGGYFGIVWLLHHVRFV